MGLKNNLEKAIGEELYSKIEKTVELYVHGNIPTKRFDNDFTKYINELNRRKIDDLIISHVNGIYAEVRKHYED